MDNTITIITEERGDSDYGEETIYQELIVGDREHTYYIISGGEPEDARFDRDLNPLEDLVPILRYVHKLGKKGIELDIKYEEETWDD